MESSKEGSEEKQIMAMGGDQNRDGAHTDWQMTSDRNQRHLAPGANDFGLMRKPIKEAEEVPEYERIGFC
jgi:hypothetical protein